MNHDVFISYSRKDTAIADKICEALDRNNITYFIDRQGMGGAMEFPAQLADAISNCKIMLYLASKNSYKSKFTNAEITFAFNKKEPGSILPYIIDGSNLPEPQEFIFSAVTYRNIKDHPIDTVLIDDLLKLLNKPEIVHGFYQKTKSEAESKPSSIQNMLEQELNSMIPTSIVRKNLFVWWIEYFLILFLIFFVGVVWPIDAFKHVTSDSGQIVGWILDFIGLLCCIVFSYFFIKNKPGKHSNLVLKADYVQKKYGLSIFIKDRKYGVINMGGYKIIIPAEYDSLRWVDDSKKILFATKSGENFKIDIYNNRLK